MISKVRSIKKSLLLTAGTILALLLLINLVNQLQINRMKVHQSNIIEIHQPLLYQLASLKASCNHGVVSLDGWIRTQQQHYRVQLDSILQHRIIYYQQSLDSSRASFNDFEYTRQLEHVLDNSLLLSNRLEDLKVANPTEADLNSINFDRKVISLINKLNKQLDQLIRQVESENAREEIAVARLQLLKQIILSALTLGFLGAFYWLIRRFYFNLNQGLKQIDNNLKVLSKGNLPEDSNSGLVEVEALLENVRSLKKNLGNVKEFALAVGEKHFEKEIDIFDNQGEIGKSLLEMRESLKTVAEEEKIRLWTNEGFAKFGDILRKYGDDLQLLSDELIAQLVKYIGANQGGIFILHDDNPDDVYLELAACYAYGRKKFHSRKILPGQGLVGQCFIEKETIFLLEVPKDYIQITSGLGDATPDNILLVPLKLNEAIYGVIELASLKKIEKYEVQFIENLGESIASTFSAVKVNEKTRQLLEESQMATEQLRAQEEEMRQNMEELAATQEEMERNQNALLANEHKTRAVYENCFDVIITTDDRGIIDLFNPAAEKVFQYSRDEVVGKNIKLLMPEKYATNHDEKVANYHQYGHKNVIGKPRELKGKRKNGEEFDIRMKVDEAQVGEQKIFLAFIEDITEEVNLRRKLENDQLNLSEKESNLSAVINSTSDTIFAIDSSYRITVANEVLRAKYSEMGIELEAGKNILEILPEDLAGEWKGKYDRALAGEHFNFIQKQIQENQSRQVEVFVSPIKNAEGQVSGALIISRDITKYMQGEGQVELELERLKELQEEIAKEKLSIEERKDIIVSNEEDPELNELIEKQIMAQEMLLMKLSENESQLKNSLETYQQDIRKKKRS